MNHTPAPWTLEPPSVIGYADVRFGIKGSDDGCATCISTVHTTDETAQANARLIAAAPDLLTALKKLLSFDDVRYANDRGRIDEGWQSDELVSALAACDTAIAKAEGL